MSKKTKKASSSPSWKAIAQPKLKRGVTPKSRLRQLKWWLRIGAAGLCLIALGAIGAGLMMGYNGFTAWVSRVRPDQSFQSLIFETDGVLPRSWVEKQARLPVGSPLLAVDLFDIKERLIADGQVESATIERCFPSSICIHLKESQPLLKILVQDKKEKPTLYLVSKEGRIYTGKNYPPATIAALPYLEGVKLQKKPGGGFFPVMGINSLAELLEEARTRYPELYGQWKAVSCQRYQGNPEAVGAAIKIQTFGNQQIIFAPIRINEQLDRLAYIDQYLKENPQSPVRVIDLSLEDQATLQTDTSYPRAKKARS